MWMTVVATRYIRDTCGVADYSDQHILNALGLFEMYGTNMQNGEHCLNFSNLLTHSYFRNFIF